MIINPSDGAVNTNLTGGVQPIIQNLGPGNLYVGRSFNDLATQGIWLPAGAVYEFPAELANSGGTVWIQADGGTADVRILNVG
jgi:hypothetical protein